MQAARANAPPGDATAQELTGVRETDAASPSPSGTNVQGPSTSGTAAKQPPGTISVSQLRALNMERRNAPRDVMRFRLTDV